MSGLIFIKTITNKLEKQIAETKRRKYKNTKKLKIDNKRKNHQNVSQKMVK